MHNNIDRMTQSLDEVEELVKTLIKERDGWKELYFLMKDNYNKLSVSVEEYLKNKK